MNSLYSISNDFYYVYEHWLDDEIIYVGKGRVNRAESKYRNVYWRAKVGDRVSEVRIVIRGYFLKEKDALTFENILILEYIDSGKELCNIIFNKKISTLFSEKEINDFINKDKSEKEMKRLRRARKKSRVKRRPISKIEHRKRYYREMDHINFPCDLLDEPLDISIKRDLIEKLNVEDTNGRRAGWLIISRALTLQGFTITNKQLTLSGVRKRVSFVSSKSDL